MVKNKRGWITILEATIAVMLVAGVLIVVYSRQGEEDTSLQDYVFSLQKQILMDIASNSEWRTLVLAGDVDGTVDGFVGGKIPPAYGYSLKICKLDGTEGFCKLDTDEVIATMDKEIFVEEIVISAELDAENSEESVYGPMKVRLFVWEGRDEEEDEE